MVQVWDYLHALVVQLVIIQLLQVAPPVKYVVQDIMLLLGGVNAPNAHMVHMLCLLVWELVYLAQQANTQHYWGPIHLMIAKCALQAPTLQRQVILTAHFALLVNMA
jgi:hypothetical protein